MLETLLAASAGTVTYTFPDSGPGPITLAKGTPDLGYFGLVPSSDLFNRLDIQIATGLTAKGTVQNELPQWIKMVMDNEILFVPLSVPLTGISWVDIYNAGAVYGDDTNGKYPVGAGVLQDLRMVKEGKAYKVRLFNGGTSAGLDPSPSASKVEALVGSEHLRFMASLIVENTYAGWVGPSWKLFTLAQMVGTTSWTRTTLSTNVQAAITAGSLNSGSVTKTSTSGWLPVLELDTDNTRIVAIAAPSVGYNLLDILRPPMAIDPTFTSAVPPESPGPVTGNLVPIARASLRYDIDMVWMPVATEVYGILDALPIVPIRLNDISTFGIQPIVGIDGTPL